MRKFIKTVINMKDLYIFVYLLHDFQINFTSDATVLHVLDRH